MRLHIENKFSHFNIVSLIFFPLSFDYNEIILYFFEKVNSTLNNFQKFFYGTLNALMELCLMCDTLNKFTYTKIKMEFFFFSFSNKSIT